MKENEAAVVCCIEKGGLEYKGLCMILSLRKNWGNWKDIPIYAYSPRKDNIISDWLREIYRDYNVVLVDEPINLDYNNYPLANKPLSMAHAEKNIRARFLIFLDSDILCWNEPKLFVLPKEKDLGMVIDGTKTVASSGPGDIKNETMWQYLYGLSDVKIEPYVTTLLTDEIVRGWWSSGVIICRSSANLMERWLAIFSKAMKTIPFIPEAYYLREQMTICAVAASAYERFFELPVSYNYPVQNFTHYMNRGTHPNAAILWHYQPYMNKAFRKLQESINGVRSKTEKVIIAEQFIEKVETKYQKMIGLDESVLSKYRRQLAIGTRLREFFNKYKNADIIF